MALKTVQYFSTPPPPTPPRERSFYRGREQGEGQLVAERTPNYQYLTLRVYQLTGDRIGGVLVFICAYDFSVYEYMTVQ